MKSISILGSTGSIGSQTLEIIRMYPERFKVVGLSAGTSIDKLYKQIHSFEPEFVSVSDEQHAIKLREMLRGRDVEVFHGDKGYERIVTDSRVDLVVSSMVGASGLKPTYSAIRAGKNVALANKESLVIAGELLMSESKRSGSIIIPVDSEHSAIFQLLNKDDSQYIKRVIITASGGPFRNIPEGELEHVTVEDALNHPTWSMGSKITIDSATLMNKGFEIIEAKWLFDMPIDDISVWIHPQSIVHSMVEYIDGSFTSQLSIPDMRIPIAYALAYPERIELSIQGTNPSHFTDLGFYEVDTDKFRSVNLARSAAESGGAMPAVLNGSNEIAVYAFLNKKIKFTEIMRIVERTMDSHKNGSVSSLEEILEADAWARSYARNLIQKTGDL